MRLLGLPATNARPFRASLLGSALVACPASFGVLDVFVDDKESPLPKPLVP